MDRLNWLDSTWQFLTRDVAIAHGFQSPMLSWLGACGILLMFLWHSYSLIRASVRIRQAFHRTCPLLARLIQERQSASKEWIVIPSLAKKQSPLAHVQGGRRDLDDLQMLDRAMRAEHTFAGEWLSYRKTFSVEQPSWFIEPTVHTKRSAAEFFTIENICAGSMDVRFYQQLPSIITGVGLTFTFLAILIGLSKLHANGAQIDGIQGLINGLAGKFITSIIGLACANLFVVLEKSLFYRLATYYRQFISMLDEMFPQKVHDHGAYHAMPGPGQAAPMTTPSRNDSFGRLAESLNQRLGATVTALTAVSESLSTLGTNHAAPKEDELARTIGSTLRKELSPLLDPLHEAIRELTRSIATMHGPDQLSPPDMERLVETFKYRLGVDPDKSSEKATLRSAINRLSWMFPQSRAKHSGETLVE